MHLRQLLVQLLGLSFTTFSVAEANSFRSVYTKYLA
jgi:hypothetical protein